MKHGNVILASILALSIILPLCQVQGKTEGYWETYTYTRTVNPGEMGHHQHEHTSALDAYAVLVSSTGKCSFYYDWNYPWLQVFIVNEENYPIQVTWKEYFYVS